MSQDEQHLGDGAFERFEPLDSVKTHRSGPDRGLIARIVALFVAAMVFVVLFIFMVVIVSVLGSVSHSVSQLRGVTDSILHSGSTSRNEKLPPLILQLTIDQLRSDEVQRYRKKYTMEHGWNSLFEKGTFFRNAHYQHLLTFTPVGHSTLVTGGNGFSHGVIAKYFMEDDHSDVVFCIADESHSDPTGGETLKGTSPKRLLSTTIGDELRLNWEASRSFSVSEKDYVGVLQAGHLGKGFWYSKKTGRFVTSTYYYEDAAALPEWVTEWNDKKMADSFQNTFWETVYPVSSYRYQDGREWNRQSPHLGVTFPKPLGSVADFGASTYYSGLYETPISDVITVDFAKTLIEKEGLGLRESTDYLALSLSANDVIGHHCGPNSIEKEDNLYHLDRRLDDLFRFLSTHLVNGLDDVLVILSSDHGADYAFERNAQIGFSWSDHQFTGEDIIPAVDTFLNESYGGVIVDTVCTQFTYSSLYFDYEKLAAAGIPLSDASRKVAEFLPLHFMQVAMSMSRPDILTGNVPNHLIGKLVLQGFHPKRSGDVVVIQEQHVYSAKAPDQGYAMMHGSPWSYDTHVPLFFKGVGIAENVVIDRRVAPHDVAPTIAAMYALRTPSASIGNPLEEVTAAFGVNPQN